MELYTTARAGETVLLNLLIWFICLFSMPLFAFSKVSALDEPLNGLFDNCYAYRMQKRMNRQLVSYNVLSNYTPILWRNVLIDPYAPK